MSIDRIIATILSLSGIIFTYWFFLMKKESNAVSVTDHIKIIVDGGYTPSVIEVAKDKATTLEFFRKDPSSCLEEVVIPDFHIRQFLPLQQSTEITITPKEVGEYTFHCGMSMFFGKIKVV